MPPEVLTKDDVPLRELADFAVQSLDVFNDEASQGFIDRFSKEVDERTFIARAGDVSWDEVAELEHAQTSSPLQDYQMAFNVKTYAKSLGLSREFVEDSSRDRIEEHLSEIIAGGRQTMFDSLFSVLKSGIADGSQLWYDPEDHGDYSFSNTHNHTFTGLNNSGDDTSNALFDDTSNHTPTEIVRELSHELTHHGYEPDVALVNQEFADLFIEEKTDGHGSQFFAPQAENLVSSSIPDNALTVNGVDILQTAWLSPHSDGDYQIYMYDSGQNPVARNTVREMEITDNTGSPIAGAGGFRGDPGALLGAYGSMRFGTVFDDPLAGVKIEQVDPASVSTS